jgi:hypothetical protein
MKVKKQKAKKKNKNSPLSFKGMPFEEALSALLKVKPEPKPKKNTQKK